MDAERFPITTPYGQVPGYELNNGWHRGEDRAMPMDTPVLVNGHEIGLSGNSGQVTGPHLHIGRFVGGHDTPPNGGGFHFGSAVVTEVNEDPVNGKFVRVQADGASWVYLHLSRQTVPVGQELISLVQAPTPPPTPTTYTIIESYDPARLVRLNKQPTYLWGMNYHFDYRKDHPIETHNQGETWPITNKIRSEDGNEYYRRDGQVDGFHVADCDDYVYQPPAAPVPVKLAPKVKLDVPVHFYSTASNAQTGYKPSETTLPAGEYYQISTELGMVNLSADNMKDLGQWVNLKDNRLPVKVEVKPLPQPVPTPDPQPTSVTPWFNKVDWFNAQCLPVIYLTTKDTVIRDYSGNRPEVYPLEIGHELKVYGTITDPGNTKYYLSKLPKADAEFQYRYAVPMVDPDTGRALLLKKATKPVRNRDHVSVIASELEEMGLQFIDFIPRSWRRLETKIIKKG